MNLNFGYILTSTHRHNDDCTPCIYITVSSVADCLSPFTLFSLHLTYKLTPLSEQNERTMISRTAALGRQAGKVFRGRSAAIVTARSTMSTSSSAGDSGRLMYPIIPAEDFGAFKEYSVIHTDRSLNLMSDPFQRVMRDLNELLKVTYNADKVVIIPG